MCGSTLWHCWQPLKLCFWYHFHNCSLEVWRFYFITICAYRHLNSTLNFLSWIATWNFYSLVWRQNVALSHLMPLWEYPTGFHCSSKHTGIDPLWATGKGTINCKLLPRVLLTSKLWGWGWGVSEVHQLLFHLWSKAEMQGELATRDALTMQSIPSILTAFPKVSWRSELTSSVTYTVKSVSWRWFWLLPAPWDLGLLVHPLSALLFQL